MRKYQIIFTLSIWLFSFLWFYIGTHSSQDNPKVYLRDLNQTVKNFQDLLDVPKDKIYPNNFGLWDMKISRLLEKRESKEILVSKKNLKSRELENKPKVHNINVKYRTICVEKECWELMGIVTINGIKTLTLLTKENRPTLQIFKVGEELLPKILIKDIKGESMILLNKEKDKIVTIKLFDVDISEYIPKTVKEEDE